MNIVVCGAGEVGSHAAEVLATAGTSITLIDTDTERLRSIEDTLDVATYAGNCARADVLIDAGVRGADAVVAATDSDEVNLLTATIARGLGAKKTIARVHHSAYFEQRHFDYKEHLGIDRLICPEYSTALAIARTLRNPGALAIEGFARGRIEMQELPVSKGAAAIGTPLLELTLPPGVRVAVVTRKGGSFVPEASTVIEPEDTVILVGNADVFQEARRLFHDDRLPRQRVIMMGGTPMAVWLARSLRDRSFAIRLFETKRARAEEIADKLPWLTVLQADPTDRSIFDEEHLSQADVYIALEDDDRANIISGVLAKLRGVPTVIAVVQQFKHLDMIYDIGVDKAFSPRIVATDEIESVMDERPLRHLASLAAGFVDVYRVRVGDRAPVIDQALKDIKLSPTWMIAAISRDGQASVPGANDVLQRGDTVLAVGKHGQEKTLKTLLVAK